MNPANADAPSTGRKYWRSLSELEGKPEFEDYLRREFPVSGDQFPDNVSRRRWLQLMGASLTLAGAIGCRYEKEIIAPFAQRPRNRVPGKPQFFATTIEYAGAARPLLMTCFDGRPVKPEGNPEHPESFGATDLYSQASALELYDPDRARTGYEVLEGRAEELDEEETIRRARTFFTAIRGGQAGSTVVLTETTSSPTMARLMGQLAGSGVEWVQFSPVSDDNERVGLREAFGADLVAQPLLNQAKVILSLDHDFIASYDPATVRRQHDFIEGRNPDARQMNRLYCVESKFTMTGMKADHRLAIRSSLIGSFLGQLFGEVQRLKSGGVANGAKAVADEQMALETPDRAPIFLAAVAEDLAAAQGQAVVIVGQNQPPEVHALAARLNDLIGAPGATLEYRSAPNPRPVCIEALATLADRLNAGEVDNLVVIGGNPAFDAPSDIDFGAAMLKAGNVVRIGMWVDETSLVSDLHLPQLHAYETWGDVVSPYGIWSISQPMIDPLHFGWSAIGFAAEALGQQVDAQALIRETARGALGLAGETAWRNIVKLGFAPETVEEPATASLSGEADLSGALVPTRWEEESKRLTGSIELTFFPSRTVYDGRFANNGWLQEFPDPISKVTWDNVLYVNPETATALRLRQGELARISVAGSEIAAPVFIQPGQANGSLAIALGYGRISAGKIGGAVVEGIEPVGTDVSPVRRSDTWWIATDVTVASTGTPYKIATTQDHNAIDEFGLKEIRDRAPRLVREGTYEAYLHFLDEYEGHPHGVEEAKGGHSSTAPLDETSPAVEAPASMKAEAERDEHAHEGEHLYADEHGTGHHRQFPPQSGHHPKLESLWTEWSYEGQAWGMAIDLNRCTGCNACAVACQAENNVPIVGKDQVARNREMHWLRIDRYFAGDPDNPSALHQPMLCQQCENAPCESVCPVAATVHSTEGLNDMVYNRCIGTRYCGNNCPYKVRRFNYLWYRGNPRLNQEDGDLTNLVLNPEVTVRTRGVMEKCTFCVQRIQNVKIEAKTENRPLGPNEIQTACQQACPTEAIIFGDLNREESLAAQLHRSPRAYALLEELNTKPRNRYLAQITNPHPALYEFENRERV
ncbi:MAG TPA: TAT-variant-translocated molybdopterin oxidoreductase [Pirellulaceae bacterium]|jgi:molybdopterin-containing oxidoreductase family iron-sulfur binding subunit|nr:TAT-variant-translocated molybdopterin oxidoreductase [Pirellulaceae bacterium]